MKMKISGASVTAIYSDQLASIVNRLGDSVIRRASHVEPAGGTNWTADMSPVGGPVLGPFPSRSAALASEVDYLSNKLGFSGSAS